MIDLRQHFAKEARTVRSRLARRLRSGHGVGGTILPGKRQPDGRPLGGSVARALASGPISVRPDGWAINYSGTPKVGRFHRGRRGQRRRPIVGLTRGERKVLDRRAADAATRQINRRLRRGA